jgi:hypothetical protein
MDPRQFTPAEVNAVIPELEALVRYLRSLESEMREKEWRLRQALGEAKRHGQRVEEATFLEEEAEIDFLRIMVRSQFERVVALGGEVKGGYLVDFPGVIHGEPVLLCWKPGETEVRWYHGLNEGMTGRRPIPEELLFDTGSEER